MESSVKDPPGTAGADANGNGTHPDLGEDEQREQIARMVGLDEMGQLSFAVGGKKPDTSKFKLAGRSVELPKSQLEKGTEVFVLARVRTTGVHFDDKIDSATESVTGCTRKQVARIVGDLHVIADEDAQALVNALA